MFSPYTNVQQIPAVEGVASPLSSCPLHDAMTKKRNKQKQKQTKKQKQKNKKTSFRTHFSALLHTISRQLFFPPQKIGLSSKSRKNSGRESPHKVIFVFADHPHLPPPTPPPPAFSADRVFFKSGQCDQMSS
jgi:hypothetical protein